MNDGKFEVVLKNIDLTIFAKIITGNIPLESGDVEIISTDRANIKLHSPVSFQIDGVLWSRDRIECGYVSSQIKSCYSLIVLFEGITLLPFHFRFKIAKSFETNRFIKGLLCCIIPNIATGCAPTEL
jgi:hypothetical protein